LKESEWALGGTLIIYRINQILFHALLASSRIITKVTIIWAWLAREIIGNAI